MKKNLLGETIYEPWEQELYDNILKGVKEIIEKYLNQTLQKINKK